MRRFLTLALTGFVVVMMAGVGGSAATPLTPPSTQEIARQILQKATLSGPARAALEMIARGDRSLSGDPTANAPVKASRGKAGHGPAGGGMANVRVSNPGEDTTQLEQTTQSETSIAVSGQNVAVGFNDSQTTLLFLTAGSDLSGFAYSRNGGMTFVDGGQLPNGPAMNNFGDPWLASDSAGNMYYSTLSLDFNHFALNTALSKSTDGGKTWTAAAPIPPPTGVSPFGYSADKDALSAGPGVGNLYDSWDDFTFSFDPNTGAFQGLSGLPVAHTTNGGQTWSNVYAAQTVLFSFNPTGPPNCSFHQFIGAQPFVGPDGTVYDAALKFGVDDPTCTGAPFTENEWIFASHDGGATWNQGTKIADAMPASGFFFGAFQLGPGQLMRELELPSVAVTAGPGAGTIYVSWNDGSVLAPAGSTATAGGGPGPGPGPGGSGHSHIALAKSTDGGNTWSTVGITSGDNDEAQPAVSADSSGVHDLYYEITPSPANDGTRQLDVFVSDSTDGGQTWSPTRVTTQSFPGVYTFPQFDPIIAFGYMGDYIANVSDGTHQYFSWGDNRDVVNDFLWPNGRHDPDVWAAVR